MKGVSKESCDDSSVSEAWGRPMPMGKDREKTDVMAAGVAVGPKAGTFQAGARGGAMGASRWTVAWAAEGVCA